MKGINTSCLIDNLPRRSTVATISQIETRYQIVTQYFARWESYLDQLAYISYTSQALTTTTILIRS
ncbi:8862_t:CDS:2 [Funneliformis geosporum]|uniref:8862_t:CDS:1 n=1 Tax=Funneliformis geosporum TaxID=1117311 RepID=A0A9W4WLQ5_9GLOM|nr:8862_t:CDS:2 [Funneliformis geosporum]